jgi:hypothetical protein
MKTSFHVNVPGYTCRLKFWLILMNFTLAVFVFNVKDLKASFYKQGLDEKWDGFTLLDKLV